MNALLKEGQIQLVATKGSVNALPQGFGTEAAFPEDLGVAPELGALTAAERSAREEGTRTGTAAVAGVGERLKASGESAYTYVVENYGDSAAKQIKSLVTQNKAYYPDLTLDMMAENWLAKRAFVNTLVMTHPEFREVAFSEDSEVLSRSFVLALTRSGSLVAITPGAIYKADDDFMSDVKSGRAGRSDATATGSVVVPMDETSGSVPQTPQNGGEMVYIQIDKRKGGVELANGKEIPEGISIKSPNYNVVIRSGAVSGKEFHYQNAVPTVGQELCVVSTGTEGKYAGKRYAFFTSKVEKVFSVENPADGHALLQLLEAGMSAIDEGTMTSSVVAPMSEAESVTGAVHLPPMVPTRRGGSAAVSPTGSVVML